MILRNFNLDIDDLELGLERKSDGDEYSSSWFYKQSELVLKSKHDKSGWKLVYFA